MILLLSALSYFCYYVLKYEMFSKLGYPHEVVRLYTQMDHQLKYQLKYRNFNFPKVKPSSGRLLRREHSLPPFFVWASRRSTSTVLRKPHYLGKVSPKLCFLRTHLGVSETCVIRTRAQEGTLHRIGEIEVVG